MVTAETGMSLVDDLAAADFFECPYFGMSCLLNGLPHNEDIGSM